MRNILCSSFSGKAKPLIILGETTERVTAWKRIKTRVRRSVCALPAQNLQQLSDAVVMFCLIDESVDQQRLNKMGTLVLTVNDCCAPAELEVLWF